MRIQAFILETIELEYILDHLDEIQVQPEVFCRDWWSNIARGGTLHICSSIIGNTLAGVPPLFQTA